MATPHIDSEKPPVEEVKQRDIEYKKTRRSVVSVTSTQEPDNKLGHAESPTEEEKKTLQRVAGTIPWNAYCERRHLPFIISASFCVQ